MATKLFTKLAVIALLFGCQGNGELISENEFVTLMNNVAIKIHKVIPESFP